jgi:hypothetical protein
MTLYKKIPLKAMVFARDKKQNSTEKIFFIFYSDSILQKDTVKIGIQSITQTEIISNTKELVLIGTAESFPPLQYTLKFFENGEHLIDQDTVFYYHGIWGCHLHIKTNSINDFTVYALSLNNDTLGKLKVSIIHNNGFSDTTGPVFSRVYVNNSSYIKGMIVENAVALITILAFDPGSGIQKVMVNGVAALSADTNLFTWQSDVSLFHGVNKIPVALFDNSKNSTRDTLEITGNRKPSILSFPTLPYYLAVNKIYYDTLEARDPDGDSIIITLQSVIPNLTITSSQSGVTAKILMRWAPQTGDMGSAGIKLNLYDGLQYSPGYSWTYRITKDSVVITPVTFLTTSNNLIKVFITDSASLTDTLRIIPGAGAAPFRFNARMYPEDTILLQNASLPYFRWKPAMKDTGSHLILFTVHDINNTSDSIFHAIHVVNKNSSKCTLTVQDIGGGNLLSGNTVSFVTTAVTAKLRFTIIDHDNPFEQYMVKQTLGSATTTMQTDSNWFTIAIIPKLNALPEVLTVTVFDKTGGSTMNRIKISINYPQSSNPDDIGSLFLWLKADNEASIKVTMLNDWVTSWISSNNSGRTLQSYAYAPTYMKNANPKYIQFNRTDNQFLYGASINFTTTAYTILAVAQNKTLTSGSREAIVSLIDGNNYGFGFGLKGSTLNSYFADNMNTFYDLSSDTLLITAKKWFIFTYTFASTTNSATVDQRCNGKTGAFNTTDHYLPAPVRIMVGTYGNISQPVNSSNADIAEIIIYDRKLTIPEIQKVESYLSNKFGIPMK